MMKPDRMGAMAFVSLSLACQERGDAGPQTGQALPASRGKATGSSTSTDSTDSTDSTVSRVAHVPIPTRFATFM